MGKTMLVLYVYIYLSNVDQKKTLDDLWLAFCLDIVEQLGYFLSK